ncbi:MAG: 30S ribosomal protein S20, partial [Aquificota bacterium]|nr:30S ribosomal protein S20 [Aquificota bacterium]
RQALKRMRRDAKRRERNRYHLSRMRTYIKNFRRMIEEGKLKEAQEYLPEVVSVIYHTASKGVIHKNEASRRVSRLYDLLNKALKESENQGLSQEEKGEEVKESS